MVMIYEERVRTLYFDCMCTMTEDVRLRWIVIDPESVRIELNPARVGGHLGEIEAILEMFPTKFYAVNGPGAPISDALYDRSGNTWTSDMSIVNMIFVLGVAIGRVKLFKNPNDYNYMWAQIA